MYVTVIWIVALHVLKVGVIIVVLVVIKQLIHVIIAITNVLLLVICVLATAILVMMYTVGAIGLLVILEAAELETVNNAQALLNYLNSIVSYKFGNLYIYCNYCSLYN